MKNREVLLLLRSYTLNFPILSDWHLQENRPIGLIFQEASSAYKFCRNLSAKTVFFNINEKADKVRKTLCDENSEAICIFCYEHGRYTSIKAQQNFEVALQACSQGHIEGFSLGAAIFFVFTQYIPEEMEKELFPIFISKGECEIAGAIDDLVPNADELPIIFEKIKQMPKTNALPLKAAAAFTLPKLMVQERGAEFEKLLETAENIAVQAEMGSEGTELSDAVMAALIAFYEDKLPKVIDLDNLEVKDKSDIEDAWLVRGDRLYLPEKAFGNAIEGILNYVRVQAVKQRIQEENLLLGKKGEYTQKIYVRTGKDTLQFRRMALNLELMPELSSYLKEEI